MSTLDGPVPFLDLSQQYHGLEAEWLEAVRAIGRAGSFILGPNVAAFEQEFAAYVGTRHAIGVANGTDALVLALRALDIGPGAEVITTPYTFFASAEAIDTVGATPVFCDISRDGFTIDPTTIKAKINERTRAILPVHIFGRAADMGAISRIAREHRLAVIEDCAQACGAEVLGRKVGAIGDVGCFSFYPTKVLGCYGDGGMVTTDSDALNERIRHLRNHGAVKPFVHTEIGCNSRLDEIQAALLRIKLRDIQRDIAGRRAVAHEYSQRLAGTAVVVPVAGNEGRHVFNLFTIRAPNRDRLRQVLNQHQIGTSLCYPIGLHLQEVYRRLGYAPGSLPVCEQMTSENLSLPIYPGMPVAHIKCVCEVIKKAL